MSTKISFFLNIIIVFLLSYTFLQATELTGIIITKLDGTSKGGVVIGIVNEFDIPVRYIGIGEQVEDLRPFDAQQFTESIFA